MTTSSFLSIGFIPEDQVNKIAWVPVTSSVRWVLIFSNYYSMKKR